MDILIKRIHMNFSNIITFSRIVGISVIFFLFPFSNVLELWIVFFIFILVALSDFLDGYLARKLNLISEIGALLDPLADKISLLILLLFISDNLVPAWAVFILISREFCVLSLRVYATSKNIKNVSSKYLGKLKTTLSFIIMGILILRLPLSDNNGPSFLQPAELLRNWVYGWPQEFVNILIFALIFLSLYSLKNYFIAYLPYENDSSSKS